MSIHGGRWIGEDGSAQSLFSPFLGDEIVPRTQLYFTPTVPRLNSTIQPSNQAHVKDHACMLHL